VLVWGQVFGGASHDSAKDVAVDGAGNVYVVGFEDMGGTVGYQHLLRKYNSSGDLQFAWWPGTSADDLLMAADVNATGAYVAGSQGGKAFVGKIYEDIFWGLGWEWFAEIGPVGATTRAQGLMLDGEGQLYVGGFTTGTIAGAGGSNGGTDAWVARYFEEGFHSFTRQFGTSGDDLVLDVVAGPDLTAHVIGYTNGNLALPTSIGGFDVFLAQWNVRGEMVRESQFGTIEEDVGAGLASTQRKQCGVGKYGSNAFVRCAHNDLP
jgi:hypothetical protein